MDFDRIVEKILREAQANGKFDNLPGSGRPLKLDDANENSEDWAANHLLQNQNLRPAWLEEDLAIQAELEQARKKLRRTHGWYQTERAQLQNATSETAIRQREWAEAEWRRTQTEFRESLAQLNLRQRNLNLKVPLERFQRRLLDVEAELAQIIS
jgi:DnaJ family protein C protein 28